MKKACIIEPENKPYCFTEKEKRYLRAQYNDFVDYFDNIFHPDGADLKNMVMYFNNLQAMVSINVCFMEAVRRILISKGIATKKEMNDIIDDVYEEQMKMMKKSK